MERRLRTIQAIQILDESLGHIGRQLELVRRRRDEIAALEDELVSRRKRARTLLRELDREPAPDQG